MSLKFIKKHKKEGLKFFAAFKDIAENNLNFNKYDIVIYKGVQNKYRMRLGDYRAIFDIKEEIITINVLKIGSRGDVYK